MSTPETNETPAPRSAPAAHTYPDSEDSGPTAFLSTWIAVLGSCISAFMALLNIQMVNASLADIQGAIGARIDNGGWISAAYLTAGIVVIPLSGWLAHVSSIRIYLLSNAVVFCAFAIACSFARHLGSMIALRAVQGFTGNVLIPMTFTIIITLLPKAKLPIVLALYGSVFILPIYLARIHGYNAEQIGTVLAWTDLPQLALIQLVPRLKRRFDTRLVIAVGSALFAASNFMHLGMTPDYIANQVLVPNIMRAIGQVLMFAPLSH